MITDIAGDIQLRDIEDDTDTLHGADAVKDENRRGDFIQQVAKDLFALYGAAGMGLVTQILAHRGEVTYYVSFQNVVNIAPIQAVHKCINVLTGPGRLALGHLVFHIGGW